MDIQAEKLNFIHWFSGITDLSTIKAFIALKKEKEADWWDTLTSEQREDIEAGLTDLGAGKKKDFEQVIRKYR